MAQHKDKKNPASFASRYNMDRLVYFEAFGTIVEAIARETAIKNVDRLKKIRLIVALNPTWRGLGRAD